MKETRISEELMALRARVERLEDKVFGRTVQIQTWAEVEAMLREKPIIPMESVRDAIRKAKRKAKQEPTP